MSSGKRCPRADCRHGGALQPLENFHRNRTRPDGHASHCKDCANASNRRRRSKTGRGWLRYRKPDGFSGVGTPADLICDDFEIGMLRVRASLEAEAIEG